ncbi:MAG: N-acetyltransferase [Hoeflea sp.]|uniref:GNAT family N-acetyltransferase n=1 Tax=Hoeflea sp. TaxID=1940281 RepID=UPI001DF3CB07|nr:N-acetyltransferase [Hoeflea sp.]MBU4528178.1 N-acetyltransferase [Alphaproteobacteria bacterium]MBU4543774.1 N-acetyltransferase [Alphaproteobacteria bacterium]MBU4548641.1 N-acetyltransferase [Alphaproteobacteria bacterium]MBV1725807.1 N-acetyltransferase [Hoeflea sp.]MBV1762163.1 N-acetyltransferase [Hoeflea sp.]
MTAQLTILSEAGFAIDEELGSDANAREALLDRAMGEGRKRKSSEKLRRGRLPSAGLAFVARSGSGAVTGSVRLWDVACGEKSLLLLGPLAVEPSASGQGIGSALMRHAMAQAAELGHSAIILVGDAPYYARFGFSAEKTGGVLMPGPVERDRLLGCELLDGHLDDASGLLIARGRRADRRQSSSDAMSPHISSGLVRVA